MTDEQTKKVLLAAGVSDLALRQMETYERQMKKYGKPIFHQLRPRTPIYIVKDKDEKETKNETCVFISEKRPEKGSKKIKTGKSIIKGGKR